MYTAASAPVSAPAAAVTATPYKVHMTVPRGKVKVDKDVKMSRAQVRQLEALAKNTNTAVTVGGYAPVDENGNQKRGWYVEDDGHIHIYADARVVLHTNKDARTAFEAGERDARIADAATASEKSGILHGASDKEIDTAKRLSKVFGRDVLFVNVMGVDGFNGCYIEDGNIYLQVGAKDPILQTVSHEFVHSLESKKLYKNLRDFVFAELMRGGKTEDELRAEKKAQNGYGHLGGEDLDKEIVAQWVAEKLLTDEKTIRRIVREKGKTFAQKLHDLWNALVAKAKSAFGEKTDAETQRQINMIERGRALLAEVIKSEEGASDGGVRYELNPNFAVAYDNWINKYGRRDDMSLLVGKTSAALQSIGIKEHSIYWPTQKINTSLADHQELTDDIMKQIPDILENPIIVLESNSVEAELENPESNRIVMFGEVYGEDGMPIMAVLELEPKNRKGLVMDQIRLISTYTRVYENDKRNLPAIKGTQDLINDGYILYIEPQKNRTNAWLRRNRLQLPFGVTKYGPINKVSYRSDFVNSDFMQKQKKDAKSTKKTSAATALEKFLEKNPDFKFADDADAETVDASGEERDDAKDGDGTPRVQASYASDEAEEHSRAAVEHFGRTNKWEATGYLLTDGTRLDLSGGQGRRTYGHHVIGKAIGIEGGVRGQIRFMQEGNVRVSPELPGIELNATTEPTEEQYSMLARFVDKVADGESFAVDFTDKDGKYLDTIEYEGGLHAGNVLADIRQFYRNGAIRKPSELSRFRYSFTEDAPKMPNGEDVPSSNDVRISPLASAEKMLRGGMPWSEVQKRTKLTMRQIALQMKANGTSAEGRAAEAERRECGKNIKKTISK